MATLNQIFHWAVENTTPRDPNSPLPEAPQPIDKKWLDLILKSDATKMKELMDIYLDNNSTIEEKEACLEELEFYVQMIDNANDLSHPSINGLNPILLGIKENEKATLRMRCAWIIATAISNNAKLQNQLLDLEGTKLIIESLKLEIEEKNRGNLEVLSKIVTIISSLLQHNTRAQKEFWQIGGFRFLFQVLKTDPNTLPSQEEEKINSKEEESENEEEKNQETKSEDDRKNIVATFDIVEVKERVSKRAKQIKKWNKNKKCDKNSEWMKIARKIVFLMARLMDEAEQFKLAFVKEQNGEAIDILLYLLEKYLDDGELVEKIGGALQGMLNASNATLQNYIIGLLKAKKLKEHVEKVVATLKSKTDAKVENFDHTDSFVMFNNILSKL